MVVVVIIVFIIVVVIIVFIVAFIVAAVIIVVILIPFFRNILEIFDNCDGLRKLYNTISMLSIISDKGEEREELNDDQVWL